MDAKLQQTVSNSPAAVVRSAEARTSWLDGFSLPKWSAWENGICKERLPSEVAKLVEASRLKGQGGPVNIDVSSFLDGKIFLSDGGSRDRGSKIDDHQIYFVNGMTTTLTEALQRARSIEHQEGVSVHSIYNGTDGGFYDLAQAFLDKTGYGSNAAVETTVRLLLEHLDEKRELHLIAESHGAIIVSRAIEEVKTQLLERGYSQSRIERDLAIIKVETLAGAAMSFPDGPRYTHYVNSYDPVAFWFGLGRYGLGEGELERVKEHVAEPKWISILTTPIKQLGVLDSIECAPGHGACVIRFSRPAKEDWLEAHRTSTYLEARREVKELGENRAEQNFAAADGQGKSSNSISDLLKVFKDLLLEPALLYLRRRFKALMATRL